MMPIFKYQSGKGTAGFLRFTFKGRTFKFCEPGGRPALQGKPGDYTGRWPRKSGVASAGQ